MILGNPRDLALPPIYTIRGIQFFTRPEWASGSLKTSEWNHGHFETCKQCWEYCSVGLDGPLVTVFIVYGVLILICWVGLASEGVKFGLKNIKSLYLGVLYAANCCKKLAKIFGNQLFKSLLVFMDYSLLRDHLLFAPWAMPGKGPNQQLLERGNGNRYYIKYILI